MNKFILEKAYQIAKKELVACYDERGIVAGRRHYDDYWTRDAAFACLGALALDNPGIVDKYLSFLSSFQRKDGMIPFLIRNHLPGLSSFGIKIKSKFKPKFRSHKVLWLSKVIDSNPYFIIILVELLKLTKNKTCLEKYFSNAEKALLWCLKKIPSGGSLAREGLLAEWNDGIYKNGATLITNVLFYKAFKDWEDICREYKKELPPLFIGLAEKIKEALNENFYNGQYFIDWIDYKKHNFFDTNANLLSIIWGLATESQAEKILDFTSRYVLDKPLVKTSFPYYPFWRICLANRICGMADYTNGLIWFEPACLFTLALAKVGRQKEAQNLFGELSNQTLKYNGIYEVYEKNKKPVNRWNYKAEFPFARSAALFILAYKAVINEISF